MVGSLGSEQAEFLSLVCELRALGATRVRSGSLEVAFAGAPEPVVAPSKPGSMERAAASTTELGELAELREMRRRAEELGVDI